MGLALQALTGELLAERTPAQAARLLAIRHTGMTAALVLLAPLLAGQLDSAIDITRQRIAALVLDARLPPADKRELIGVAVADLSPVDPRGQLTAALEQTATAEPDDRPARAELVRRIDETLVAGVRETYMPAFLGCSALALLGCAAALPSGGPALRRSGAAATAAVAVVALAALGADRLAPEPVTIADPATGASCRGPAVSTASSRTLASSPSSPRTAPRADSARRARSSPSRSSTRRRAAPTTPSTAWTPGRSPITSAGSPAGAVQLEETVENLLSRLGR